MSFASPPTPLSPGADSVRALFPCALLNQEAGWEPEALSFGLSSATYQPGDLEEL